MLKLSEIRDAYERSSSKLGEINRQLCFAGFAAVWIFNKSSDKFSIPAELYWPMLMWCISLCFDVLQYSYKSLCWYLVYIINKPSGQKNPNRKETEDDILVDESEKLNIPTWALFFLKVITMSIGYIMLIKFILSQIFAI